MMCSACIGCRAHAPYVKTKQNKTKQCNLLVTWECLSGWNIRKMCRFQHTLLERVNLAPFESASMHVGAMHMLSTYAHCRLVLHVAHAKQAAAYIFFFFSWTFFFIKQNRSWIFVLAINKNVSSRGKTNNRKMPYVFKCSEWGECWAAVASPRSGDCTARPCVPNKEHITQ